jgi:hypothetical protein
MEAEYRGKRMKRKLGKAVDVHLKRCMVCYSHDPENPWDICPEAVDLLCRSANYEHPLVKEAKRRNMGLLRRDGWQFGPVGKQGDDTPANGLLFSSIVDNVFNP